MEKKTGRSRREKIEMPKSKNKMARKKKPAEYCNND